MYSIHHQSDGYFCFHPLLFVCSFCIMGSITPVVVAHLYLYVTFNFQSVVIFVFCFQSAENSNGPRGYFCFQSAGVRSRPDWRAGLDSRRLSLRVLFMPSRAAPPRPHEKAGWCLVRSCSGTGRWRLLNGDRGMFGREG